MSDERDLSALAAAVDDATAGVQLQDGKTLFYTLEALHELTHMLGGLYHDEIAVALAHIETMDEGDEGAFREYIGQFVVEQRVRFELWLKDHELPYINFWTHHSSGVILRWSITAAQ